VWNTSRKPLVGQFRFNGKDVFVIANHFDSKGGDQDADGRYQYPPRSSEDQRAGQAAVVHNFGQSILSIDRSAEVAVVGDLNDYQFSPALQILKTGSADGSAAPILTDLITRLPVDQQYTYVYNGVSQVLDHIPLTAAPARRALQYRWCTSTRNTPTRPATTIRRSWTYLPRKVPQES
jgi:predicted extracellular nuclease